jgi:hypothetical protein
MHRSWIIALSLSFALPSAGSAGAAAMPLLPATTLREHTIITIPILRPLHVATNGIVAAADGTLYFVDSFHQTVWRMLPDGRLSAFVTGTTGLSLRIDEYDNVYGTHSARRGHSLRWQARPDGALTEVGPDRGEGPFSASLVTRTAAGEIIMIAGPAVRKVGLDGRVTTIAPGAPLLGTRGGFLSRIFRDTHAHLTGLAATDNGDIYIANAARGSVIRVGFDGSIEDAYTADAGWTPAGLTAAHGVIYVLEYGAGVRVRRLEANGQSRVVAAVRPTY